MGGWGKVLVSPRDGVGGLKKDVGGLRDEC